jgi:uncharacterized membrane protein
VTHAITAALRSRRHVAWAGILYAAMATASYGQQLSTNGTYKQLPRSLVADARSLVIAQDGRAVLYNYDAGVTAPFLDNVYKSFGLSPDKRYFLYLKARNGFPTFDLYRLDLATGVETQVTGRAVHDAAWCPTGEQAAYEWMDDSNRFHVSIHAFDGRAEIEAGSGLIEMDSLQWSEDGSELAYVALEPGNEQAFEKHEYTPVLHRYSQHTGRETLIRDVDWARFAGGRLLVSGRNMGRGVRQIPNPDKEPIEAFAIAGGRTFATMREGGREILKRWSPEKHTYEPLGEGRIVATTPAGALVRNFTGSGVEYQYIPNGSLQANDVQAAGSSAWVMPLGGKADIVQGGDLYSSGACDGTRCFLTAHYTQLGYALDFQQHPETNEGNTHVLAVGDGTVVAITNTVTCNSITTTCSTGWDNYSSTCNDPNSGAGNFVAIAHLDGSYSFYAHLRSGSVTVVPGQNVSQGSHIADQGHSGSAGTYNNYLNCGDHLHFSRQVGPGVWEQSIPTDFTELPCSLACPATYSSANIELAPAPALTNIQPASGPPGANVAITLSGSDFLYGSNVNIAGTGVTVSNVSLASSSQMSAALSVSASAAPGPYNVTVTTTSGTSGSVPFTVFVPPDFSLSATPSTQAVVKGTSVGYTVSVTALNGFSGTTGFSVSGLPSGATASFSPGTVTGSGSVTMTVSTTGTAVSGSYPLTVTATSGSLSHTAGVSLTINDPPDFSLGINPATQSIVAGAGGSYTVSTTALNGFAGTVTFNVSGAPAGAVTSVSPTSVTGSGSSTLTVTTAPGTAAGNYSLTITATSGTLSHNAGATLAVSLPPDFAISATPSTQSVVAGGSAGYTVGVSGANGFAGTVTFSVNGLPAGASAAFSPTSVVSSGSSTMTVVTTGATVPGSYPLTVTATSGGLTHNAGTTIVVVAPGSGGSLAGSVATPSGPQNLTALGTLDWADWGYYTNVSLDHHAGIAQQISTYSLIGGGTAMRYTDNPIGFTWSNGTPNMYATNTPTGILVSGQNRGFSIKAPADTSVRTLKIFVGVRNAQGQLTAHLSDNSAADYSDISLNSPATSLGVYTLSYTAGSIGQTLTVTFTQVSATSGSVLLQAAALSGTPPAPDFSLSVTPSTQSVAPGGAAGYSVSVSPQNGFSGTVGFSVSGLPAGASASFNPVTVAGSGSSTMTVTTAAATAPGTYPLTLTATGGSLSHTASCSLVVAAAQDFGFSATPSSRSISPGGTTTYTVSTAAQNNFSGTVGFSVSGLPAGATFGFSPTTVTGTGSSTLTITAAAGTSAGNYPLTMTATSGSLSHTAGVGLSVSPPPDFTLSASPGSQTVTAGGSAAYTMTVSALNGFAGNVTFSLAGLPGGATYSFSPSSVAGGGSSTLTISTAALSPTGNFAVTVTASSGSLTHNAGVTLSVNAAGTGGSVTGSVATPVGNQNLTALGTLDWSDWGYGTATGLNHKTNVVPQIGTFTLLGGGPLVRYTDNPIGFTWSDGTPNMYANSTPTGVFTSGQGRGFSVTVPADTTTRTLKVFAGVRGVQGSFVAHLSDNSAPDYVDTSLNSTSGSVTALAVYTIVYHAASGGQSMTISFTQSNAASGIVTLQAATLSR